MIIILVGESASGKSSIERELKQNFGYKTVISYTTRKPREGEVDNSDYCFISENEFIEKNSNNFFAEIGGYNGYLYGSRKEDYTDNCIAVLTPHGLRQLKKHKNLSISSFYVNVPRRDRLVKSLQRGDGSDTTIEESKRRDSSDIGQFDGVIDDVDYIINNPNYEKSIRQICEEIIEVINEEENKMQLSYSE